METLTGLEEILANDPNGHQHRSLLKKLDESSLLLAYELRQPQDLETYAKLERQRRSCLAAMEVIATIWLRWHG